MAKCDEMIMESILPSRASAKDGLFRLEKPDGNGNMKGKYRKPNGGPGDEEDIKKGKCKENEERFECERTGFRYEGRVFAFNNDDLVVVVGKRIVKQEAAKKKKDKKEVDNEEIWVGVKTST